MYSSYTSPRKKGSSSTSYNYTTTSSSSSSSTPSYNYTTTSTSSSSSPYTYSTTSSYSNNNKEKKYNFSLTSDYIKHNKYDDKYDDSESDDEYEKYIPKRSTRSTRFSAQTKKDCVICAETYNMNQFIKITQNCLHPNDVCKRCVTQHIETQLNTKGNVEGITCPLGDSCGSLIEHRDVQRIVDSNLFERHDSLALKQALSTMPDFRWCKNAGCGSGQIHSGGDKEPIMTCKACGQKSCYTHDIPWHDNLTCEEYNEAKQGEDIATQYLLERETKKCPKCGVRITKNGGCNHMTCKVQSCRYEFCWLCLADYDRIRRHGNHYHERTCQLYA